MTHLLLNTIALDPNRWTNEKIPFYSLDELLPAITRAGFRFIEVWQYHLSQAAPAEVPAFHTMADDLGLHIPIVGWYPALHVTGQALRQQLDGARQLFDRACQLGADVVKLFVGNQASNVLSEAAYRRSVECMQQLAEEAAARHLTLTGETHADTLFDSVAACHRFRTAVGADHFKVCFQPYDFQDTEQTVADFRALADHVVHLHLQGRRGNTMSLLEQADLDYDVLIGVLVNADFDGYLCIEFVEGCVVDDPVQFDLDRVLANAQRDGAFVQRSAARHGLALNG